MRTIYVEKHIPRMLLTKAIASRWPDFVWTPLSAARMVDLPDPPLPGPRWIRLRNLACGICASDLSLLFVHADPSVAPAALPATQRFYLGHETVSVVTQVGPEVTRVRPGDRVIMDTHFSGANCFTLEREELCPMCAAQEPHFCFHKSAPGPRGIGGGFGDGYVTHETAVHPCPPDLSLDQAVLVEPIAVAVHAVMRHPPRAGEKVLVIGAGIIGLLTVMVLRALVPEVEIAVIARYPHQQEMARRLGADHVLAQGDYRAIAQITRGTFYTAPLNRGLVVGGFHRIYDCVANPRTTYDALRWVRASGAVVMVGAHMAPMPRIDLTPLWYHQVALVGVYAHGVDEWQGRRQHTYDWVYELFAEEKLPVQGLITHRFPLEAYREAIRVAMDKRGHRSIKVVFEMESR